MKGHDTTRLHEASRHNGQYQGVRAKPAPNETIDDCPGPLECLPAAPGVPQHFVFIDNGDRPPPK